MAISKLTSPVTQNNAINKINEIIDAKVEKSGDTMTGQLKTSFRESVATGSYQAVSTNIPDLCNELRYSSGCCGSFSLGTAYTKDGYTIPLGWYNFMWIPHRSGGANGVASADNCNYGTLYITGMNTNWGRLWMLNYSGSTIQRLTEFFPLNGTVDPANIKSGYLNIHPENSPVLIPFMHNDIAHLLKRGGSVVVTYDGTVQSVDISNVFDGSGSYWAINPTNITTIVIEIQLHKAFTYSNWVYVDFGNVSWRSSGVTIEAMNSNYESDVWTSKYSTTTNTIGHVAVSMSHAPVGGSSGSGNGFNKLRFTFTGMTAGSATLFRIAQIGIYNYGSAGLRETFMSRGIDDRVYRSISPYTTGTYDLGSSTYKWRNIYATQFNGAATRILDANNNSSEISIEYSSSGISSARWFPAFSGYAIKPISAANVRSSINAVNKSGDTMGANSRIIFPQNDSADTGIEVTNASTGAGILVGIGSGQVNRGVYDRKLNKWMVYSNATNTYLNGNAATATKATQDGSGNNIIDTYATRLQLGNVISRVEELESMADIVLPTTWQTPTVSSNRITFSTGAGGFYTEGRHCFVQMKFTMATNINADSALILASGFPIPKDVDIVVLACTVRARAGTAAQITNNGELQIIADPDHAISSGHIVRVTGVYTINTSDNAPTTPSVWLSNDAKTALLALLEDVAYVNEDGMDDYNMLYDAFYPSRSLLSISAVYTQSGTVYSNSSLDRLRPDLTVTAHYSDNGTETVTTYVLSGTLTTGTSTITVGYSGKTTTFDVIVTEAPVTVGITVTFNQGNAEILDTDNLSVLNQYLTVTEDYANGTSTTLTSDEYVLSGTLYDPVSTITVTYGSFTDTFTVNVSQTVIPAEAYKNNTTITSFSSTAARTIMKDAFYGCSNLQTISLPNVTEFLGGGNFRGCGKLAGSINLKSVTSIAGSYAFGWAGNDGAGLTVVLPSITSLGKQTFAMANKLIAVDLGSGLSAILNDTFYLSANTRATKLILRKTDGVVSVSTADSIKCISEVYVPSALIASYRTASLWADRYNAGTITFTAIEGSAYQYYYADGTAIV